MSIQQNTTQWAAHLPPSPTDAQYWKEQHARQSRCFRWWMIPVNPDFNEAVRRYWDNTLEKRPDDITAQSA